MRYKRPQIGVAAFLAVFFLCAGFSHALDVTIEPAKAQREVGGKIRVHIYATGATDLISFGVKVSFNPDVLQVAEVKKFEDFTSGWLMDADGNSSTTNDQYTTPAPVFDNDNGSVTMIGGRLIGNTTTGLSGQVLLGWIVFNAASNGNSGLTVEVAKPTPFDNFVRKNGTVDDGSFTPGQRALICVVANACEADVNGDGVVNATDNLNFRNAFPSQFGDAIYKPQYDLNGDGAVNASDRLIFRPDFPRDNCPACQ
jgi:hypothetical protein